MPQNGRPSRLFKNLNAKIASIPMILTAVVVFLGGTLWTVVYSFTDSQAPAAPALRRARAVRAALVRRRAGSISIENLAIYGILSLIFTWSSASCSPRCSTRRSASRIPSARSSSIPSRSASSSPGWSGSGS